MRRIILAAAALLVLAACGDGEAPESYAPQEGAGLRLLGTEADDAFARATEPREFRFPADHGSHPEFRTEWWYFTGNLATAQGRHFGFELTFFRYAIARPAARPEGASAWRADQVWMAHFAITDTQGQRFIARERLTREALGLAGAATEPQRVWVADWSLTGEGHDDVRAAEPVVHLLHERLDRFGVAYVDREPFGLLTQCRDRGGHGPLVQVDDRHPGAFGDQGGTDRPADATGSPGHHGDAVGEPCHLQPSHVCLTIVADTTYSCRGSFDNGRN